MPDDFHFGDLGKIGDVLADGQPFEDIVLSRDVELWQPERPFAFIADFEDLGFADHRNASSTSEASLSISSF